jgi:hypothetical protein
MYPVALDLASLSRWVSTLPRALWPRTLAPYQGGLRRCRVPRGPGPRLPAEVGFSVAMFPGASDLTSLPRWAPALLRAPQSRISPPYRGGPWRHHVSRDPRPRLLAEVSSDAGMCPLAPDLTSLTR